MVSTSTTRRWFYLFVIIHVLAWTLAPTLVRYVLPMDAIEGSIWGHQLEWGYDKNPFLNGWLTALALYLGNGRDWLIYGFCQLSIAICLWATWQFAKKILPPIHALLAVMLLEGVQYFNLHALDFNDNVLEMATWSLTILFFYQALLDGKLKNWFLTGVLAGLALMTKYYSIVLLIPMLVFMVAHKKARIQFFNPAFYFGFLTFLLIILPHIFWLFSHNFVTLDYALKRVNATPSWQNHITFPWKFLSQQLQVIIPSLILFVGIAYRAPRTAFPQQQHTIFNRQFLWVFSLAPLLVTLLLSAIWGLKLRASWGQPLLTLWCILFFDMYHIIISKTRFRNFLVIFYALFAVLITLYCTSLQSAKMPSSANYPGKIIAKKLNDEWRKHYNTHLYYVAGSRFASGNLSLYSQDHPSIFIDWDKKLSPWINENELRLHGAIFIWEKDESEQTSPEEVRKRFPEMSAIKVMHFQWMRNKKMEPVEISVAYLPPLTAT